jgi:hypothetical protein
MSLPSYAVDFRGHPACPCQVAWIPVFEAHLQFLGIITGPLVIDQLIGGFSASGGTHTLGGASDFGLFGSAADKATEVARQMGADATWHRLAGWDNGGGIEHVHSVLRGCPHLSISAQDQIVTVDHDGDGLAGTTTPDPGPRPLSGRTWQEGITWAQQQEDDMPAPKDWDAEDWAEVKKHVAAAVWGYAVNNAGTKAKAVLALLYKNTPKPTITRK